MSKSGRLKISKKILNEVIDQIIAGKTTKEKYANYLDNVKEDKDLKNYAINRVVEKVFGKGKLSWYVKLGAKIYLQYKFGI